MSWLEINAITLAVSDMSISMRFYTAIGFSTRYGGPDEQFTSLEVGPSNYLNLQLVDEVPAGIWGRVIVHVTSVDEVYQRVVAAGYRPEMAPSNASWGERYFHVRDPDGHELSFARLLDRAS